MFAGAILRLSDLNAFISEKESFGLVILEAMACGVPMHWNKGRGHS